MTWHLLIDSLVIQVYCDHVLVVQSFNEIRSCHLFAVEDLDFMPLEVFKGLTISPSKEISYARHRFRRQILTGLPVRNTRIDISQCLAPLLCLLL